MKRRRHYTRMQVARAKGALAAGLTAKAVSQLSRIPEGVLHEWNRGRCHKHVKPDPSIEQMLRDLLDVGPDPRDA